jgi:hypothetical protein
MCVANEPRGRLLRSALVLLVGLLAATLTASAQLHLGPNVQLGGSGSVSAGYNADFGTAGSDHGIGLGGQAVLNGFYYNPNFINFQLTPFYDRSQTNSDSQSLTSSSGISATVGLFGGSKTPGSITYYLDNNKSGTFGIPGVQGLTTVGNDHGINVSWSALYPRLPPLMVSFSDSASNESVIGTPGQSDSTSRSLTLSSRYTLWGFSLNGIYNLLWANSSIDQILSASQQTLVSKNSSSNFQLGAQHSLPLRGTFNSEFTHMSYTDSTMSSSQVASGSANTVSTSVSLHPIPRFSISGDAEYTNNLEGGLEQQIINSTGQVVPLSSSASSGKHFGTTAFLNLKGEFFVTGYANYSSQSYAGLSYQTTNYGASTNYTFQKDFLRGLSVNGGVVDSATQDGNEGASFVGNVNYLRHLGPWLVGAGWHYTQNVETLVTVDTTSSMSYDASAQRKFTHNRMLDFHFTGGHTAFTDQKGYLSHTENYTGYYFMGAFNVSGSYSKSYGQSILTSSGLVSVPVGLPAGTVTDLVAYGGTGYGFGAGTLLFKRLSLAAGYNRNNSSTSGMAVNSSFNGSSENVRLHYRLRKVILDAGYSRLSQDSLSTLNTHTAINSFFIGFSRWFNLF